MYSLYPELYFLMYWLAEDKLNVHKASVHKDNELKDQDYQDSFIVGGNASYCEG